MNHVVSDYAASMSSAEYQRQWRAKQGARTGQPGPPASEPCGTYAAFKRHERRDETPCDECRDAYRAYQRDLYARRKTARAQKVKQPRS